MDKINMFTCLDIIFPLSRLLLLVYFFMYGFIKFKKLKHSKEAKDTKLSSFEYSFFYLLAH